MIEKNSDDLVRIGQALAEKLGLEEVNTGKPHRGIEYRIGDGYETAGPVQLAMLVLETIKGEDNHENRLL